jgi:hypothetical protein
MPGWELDQLPETVNDISNTWIDFYANGEGLSSRSQTFFNRSSFNSSRNFIVRIQVRGLTKTEKV